MEDAMQVVRIDRKGRALDHVVAAKKSDDERVVWVAAGKGGPWMVTFDKTADGTFEEGSPFETDKYEVPSGGLAQTAKGPVKGTGPYKYNVRNAKGGGPIDRMPITDDPDVDIE
jgi:hypothetical protein